MAELKCESGSVYFSGTVTINGCTIKGVALEQNHEPTHRIHITLPWGEKKNYVGMTPGSCFFYYTNGHAILCKVCLEKVEGYTCYYKVCRTIEKCDQQFAVVDDDTGKYIPGATVEVGGVKCEHEYPLLERYQKDNLTEGSWYNVVATKTGYTCPNDICKNTFEACGDTVVLKLKAEYHPTVCSDYTDALTCAANNCYWWSDGTCHDTEEPPPPPPPPPPLKDCMICSFDIEDANGKSVTELVVGARYTVKCNIYDKAILGCAAPVKKELIGKEIKFIKT